jgi:hypothetical protein
MRWIPFVVVFAACIGIDGIGDNWEPVSWVDEGSLCLENQGTDVVVTVRAPECLSSSCSRDLGGSCEATVDGDVITLTSEVHWEQNNGVNIACTDDCGAPTVSCTIADLPDGTYTILHGAEEVEVVVPLVEPCSVF